jgi:hypothetical protein
MQVINEESKVENNELFPQILMRIFSVCKNDKNFPLKEKISQVESEIVLLEKQIEKQKKILNETIVLRDNLSLKLKEIRQENFEIKSRLLEELGSDI